MVPDQPWRTDAVLRLAARVLMSVLFVSSIATLVIHFLNNPAPAHAVLFSLALAGAFAVFVIALVVLGRTWRIDTVLRDLTTVLACFYAGFFLMLWAQHLGGGETRELPNSTARLLIAALSFQGAALLWIHLFVREHQAGWPGAFGMRNDTPRALLFGVLTGFGFLPVGWGLQTLSGWVMRLLQYHPEEQQAIQILRSSGTLDSRLVLGIIAIVMAPFVEELLFRGILYPAIKHAGFPRAALWSTAILFGAIHFNFATFLPLTVLALILVWLYEHTGNLLASIMAHSLFNTVNFIMLCVFQSMDRPPVHP